MPQVLVPWDSSLPRRSQTCRESHAGTKGLRKIRNLMDRDPHVLRVSFRLCERGTIQEPPLRTRRVQFAGLRLFGCERSQNPTLFRTDRERNMGHPTVGAVGVIRCAWMTHVWRVPRCRPSHQRRMLRNCLGVGKSGCPILKSRFLRS